MTSTIRVGIAALFTLLWLIHTFRGTGMEVENRLSFFLTFWAIIFIYYVILFLPISD